MLKATLDELKIRHKNISTESLSLNVQQLKTYKSKLITFPKKTHASKKKASTMQVQTVTNATQLKGTISPIEQLWDKSKACPITKEEKGVSTYATLRKL
nr:15536_t:CDS:2 [Entrophospora candida]